MKLLVFGMCLVALVAADVSHLFGHSHDHNHNHDEHHHHDEHYHGEHDHDHHHEHHHEHHDHSEHPGYHYEPPSIPFELPTPTYLPPVQPTPKIAYLPPVKPVPTYLPPKPAPTTTTTTTTTTTPRPPPKPKSAYLPPVVVPKYKIPIPSYAAPLEPENTYIPVPIVHHAPVPSYLPPVEVKHDDGYHYDSPSEPFIF